MMVCKEVKEIKDGKIILVEKVKKLTYKDIAKRLFPITKTHYFVNSAGIIIDTYTDKNNYNLEVNSLSKKQLEKLLAINKLMNVAKYLNEDWQPNWNNEEEAKYYIQIENVTNNLNIDCTGLFNCSIIYFKSKDFAEQAIDILGEKIIKLALCTDY